MIFINVSNNFVKFSNFENFELYYLFIEIYINAKFFRQKYEIYVFDEIFAYVLFAFDINIENFEFD